MTRPRTVPVRGGRRRHELASFLRSRRERITPEEVGMPSGSRRRTPGLRREEVAQLAGVGVTWYTWLEQGRPINASAQVLDAVARTLRLDAAEREHLYRLADVPQPPPATDETHALPQDMRTILDNLDPLPAALLNARSDVLSWNQAFAALFPGMVNTPAAERNAVWFVFTTPPCCNPILNLEEQAPEQVAIFRYRYSRHLHEPEWQEFVQRLCKASPEFARLWATHDVAPPRPCDKVFRYPAVGDVATRSTNLEVTALPGARLVVYTPVDDESRERIAWLRDHPEATAPDHRH
ncbi:Helix-turn-helix domain-containing protein [Thermomonospora echinospora]|uniref:Helix-turn-helix domain-containing protein n=1 Tax=Thermomonospora echinospora TaxID=1992 RepID=A0A1H6DRC7_9ACTN|nr:helix-turn-helix transcriptional regulator [Thermomonospora echinospora]SEG87927.1 Helix-turn-helix domain-containing protein [Thermomonospora echinospora]